MGRLRGFLWLSAGLVVATLAGIVGFVTLSKAAVQGASEQTPKPQVSVIVAASVVTVRSALTAEDLELREVPVHMVPEGAISDVTEAEGKITLVDLYPGEVVLAQRLSDPTVTSGDGRLALALAEDEVLMAFPAEDLMSQVGVLKPGDRVDLLVSLDFPVDHGLNIVAGTSDTEGTSVRASQQQVLATFCILQNVGVAAIVGGQTSPGESSASSVTSGSKGLVPRTFLFALSPQDALLLKYAKDAGGIQDIVLRAPGMTRPFSTEAVDVDYMINRYQIPTETGR